MWISTADLLREARWAQALKSSFTAMCSTWYSILASVAASSQQLPTASYECFLSQIFQWCFSNSSGATHFLGLQEDICISVCLDLCILHIRSKECLFSFIQVHTEVMVKIWYLAKTSTLGKLLSEEDLKLDIWPLKLFFFPCLFFCPLPGRDFHNLTSFDFNFPSWNSDWIKWL